MGIPWYTGPEATTGQTMNYGLLAIVSCLIRGHALSDQLLDRHDTYISMRRELQLLGRERSTYIYPTTGSNKYTLMDWKQKNSMQKGNRFVVMNEV